MNMNSLKISVLLSLILLGCVSHAQTRYVVEKGQISFTSNAKLEIINASSNKIQGLIDPVDNRFAFVVKIQSFQGFNGELQRQHFNDRYMETDKFFDATFSGKIIEEMDFSKNGTYEVRAKGNLIIHGKKQMRIIKSKVVVDNGTISIESEFIVPLTDHDISIPQIVSEKIATEIKVKLIATLRQAAKV
jgi:hypothetical protein